MVCRVKIPGGRLNYDTAHFFKCQGQFPAVSSEKKQAGDFFLTHFCRRDNILRQALRGGGVPGRFGAQPNIAMNAGSSPFWNRQRGAATGWKRPLGKDRAKCERERGGHGCPPLDHVMVMER